MLRAWHAVWLFLIATAILTWPTPLPASQSSPPAITQFVILAADSRFLLLNPRVDFYAVPEWPTFSSRFVPTGSNVTAAYGTFGLRAQPTRCEQGLFLVDWNISLPPSEPSEPFASWAQKPRALGYGPSEVPLVNLAVRKEWERRLQAMRSSYPYISVASRLKDSRDELLVPQAALHGEGRKTSVAWNIRAAKKDREGEVEQHRGYSLQMLHSDRAYDFMTGEGFGDNRMPSIVQKMRPEFVEFADARAPLPEAPATLSGEHGTGRPTAIPLRIAESYTDRNRLPALNVLNAYHRNSQLDFVPGGSMGYVESVDRVVGFESHGFRRTPAWPDEQLLIRVERYESGGDRDHPTPLPNHATPQGKWKIVRLELVSLLLHDEPCVYETETLPRMEDLKKSSTRKLNVFETKSLAALRHGEELKAEAELNEIRMVGAIRAAQQCKSCHNASEGYLLGAFSYDLQRDPPLKLKEVTSETY